MIGLDTNVLVRYITQDDAHQSRLASELIEDSGELFCITQLALAELVWVLGSKKTYNAPKNQIVAVLRQLLETRRFQISEPDLVQQAVMDYADGNADFSDCLIARISEHRGCTQTFTFDRKACASTAMDMLQKAGC